MDLYVILGLASGAKTSDIKRAYRRLARRYHPDINPGDATAKAMYRQICDAYETLVDPDRRREYDSAGVRRSPAAPSASFEFSGFDFSAAAHGPQAATFTELFADLLHPIDSTDPSRTEVGADLHAVLTVSFVEAMTGTERQVVVTRQDLCGACNGTGHVRTTEGRCGSCHGSGSVRWARGHMVFTKTCATCRGTGRRRSERCAVCFGHGRSARTEAVAVHVPPGVQPGSRLRVPRRGHAGRNGGAERRSVRHSARRAASGLSPRRRRSAHARTARRARGGPRRDGSMCRPWKGRSGFVCRRERRRDSGSCSPTVVCRARRAAAAT